MMVVQGLSGMCGARDWKGLPRASSQFLLHRQGDTPPKLLNSVTYTCRQQLRIFDRLRSAVLVFVEDRVKEKKHQKKTKLKTFAVCIGLSRHLPEANGFRRTAGEILETHERSDRAMSMRGKMGINHAFSARLDTRSIKGVLQFMAMKLEMVIPTLW
ncbi:hypothetical protein AAC387_Pa02g2969 [Persea americana]